MHIEIVMFATNAKEIVLDAIMLMFNADTDIIVYCKGRTTIQVYNF